MLFLLLLSLVQERIDLTTPETISNSQYRLSEFHQTLDDPSTKEDEGILSIVLIGQNKEIVICRYRSTTNPTATFLNNALNKVNASTAYAGNATTGSLKQRVYHRLVVMGESTLICGKTLTGSLIGAVP